MTSFDITNLMLPDVWAGHAARHPRKIALVCGDTTMDWGQLNAEMNRLGNALIRARIGKGDAVAVLMSASAESIQVMFGTVKGGACMVPLSSLLSPSQLLQLLQDAQARMIIASSDLIDLLEPVRDQLTGIVPGGFIVQGGSDIRAGWRPYEDFVDGASTHEPSVKLAPEDPFSIMYSSGTTGLPKGIVHSHRARNYFCLSNALEMAFDENCQTLTTTALYTAGTWLMVMPTLALGGTLHILPKFETVRFAEMVAGHRISHTFIVPSQIIMLLAENIFDKHDLTSLRTVLSAGSPLRPGVKTRLLKYIGHAFYELWGLTEGSSTLIKPHAQTTKPFSVGMPLIGQELVIVGADDLPLPVGEPGEIVGYGPGLLTHYHANPRATGDAMWKDARGRTFVRTGDIGKMDEEGYLYLVDRKKDMIISGGLNIYPADIEKIGGEHPAILDIVVVGVAHEKWGETPVAIIVLRDGEETSGQVLKEWINARVGKHQRVSSVEIRTQLPRNALGKVLKRELRNELNKAGEALEQ